MIYPFDKTTIGSTGLLRASDAYAEDEFFYMLSQYLHGEKFAVAVAERLLNDVDLPSILRSDIEQLHQDEKGHVAAISGYFIKHGRTPFPPSEKITASVQKSLGHEHSYLPLLILNIVVESFGIGSINLILRYAADDEIKSILKSIAEDEARHINIAQKIRDWRGLSFSNAADWLIASCAAMRESTCPISLVETHFGSEVSQRIYESALTSPVVKRQAINVYAVLMRTIRRIPHLSGALSDPALLMTTAFSESKVC